MAFQPSFGDWSNEAASRGKVEVLDGRMLLAGEYQHASIDQISIKKFLPAGAPCTTRAQCHQVWDNFLGLPSA